MAPARKERLVGAGILLGFAIIFLPMLLDGSAQRERLRRAALEKEPPRLDELSFRDESRGPGVSDGVGDGVSAGVGDAPSALPGAALQSPAQTAPGARAADPLLEAEQLQEGLARQGPGAAGRLDARSSGAPAAARAVARAPEVEENTPAPAGPAPAWVVQVGSFAERDNANALSIRLQNAGYQAFVQDSAQGSGARVFRVHVGPRQSRRAARQLLDTLQRKEHLKGMLFKTLQ